MRSLATLFGALLLTACTGDVDLGDQVSPTVLYEGASSTLALSVDETRLYALLLSADKTIIQLISCPIEQCRSQTTTLFEAALDREVRPSDTWLRVLGTHVYFVQPPSELDPRPRVLRCSQNGCASGPQTAFEFYHLYGIFSDGVELYWLDDGRLFAGSVNGSEEFASREIIKLESGDTGATTSSLIGVDASFVYFTKGDPPSVTRLRKDGTGPRELLVALSEGGSSTIAPEGAYLAAGGLLGRIRRCPLEGCEGEPEDVATAQPWPGTLMAANGRLFWTVMSASGSSLPRRVSIQSCTLPSCDEPHEAAGFSLGADPDQARLIAVNQTSVFFPHYAPDFSLQWLMRAQR